MRLQHNLYIPLYGCTLRFVVCEDLKGEVNRLYKRHKHPERFESSAEGVMVSFDIDRYHIIIDKASLSFNTLAHEIYHVVQRMLEDRDIHDEETGAWLNGYISGNLHRFLDKKSLVPKHDQR